MNESRLNTYTDLIEYKRISARWKPLCIQLVHPSIDPLHVSGPHVLACIHSEPSHTNANKFVEEIGDLALHVVTS